MDSYLKDSANRAPTLDKIFPYRHGMARRGVVGTAFYTMSHETLVNRIPALGVDLLDVFSGELHPGPDGPHQASDAIVDDVHLTEARCSSKCCSDQVVSRVR